MLRKLSTSYTDIIHRFRWAIVVELCITHHSPLDANAEEEVGDEKAIQSSVAVIIMKGEKDSSPHRSPHNTQRTPFHEGVQVWLQHRCTPSPAHQQKKRLFKRVLHYLEPTTVSTAFRFKVAGCTCPG